MRGSENIFAETAAASLVRWWQDAGLDVLVEERPRNWLIAPRAENAPAKSAPKPDSAPSVTPQATLPVTLEAFRAWLADSPDLPEANWGPKRLLPAGDPASGLMVLCGVPEKGDAEAGLLLSGEMGRLFDRILAAIGRDRSSIWLAALATVRPVGGQLAPEAARRLAEIARHHVGLVAPKRLLILGDQASRALLGADVRDMRGKLRTVNCNDTTVEAVATFHPRTLLGTPSAKAEAWKDLQLLLGD